MADSITGTGQPYVRRRRGEVRAGWLASRTRNTLRRPMRIAAVAGVAFLATLLALVLAPGRDREAAVIPPPSRQDTVTAITDLTIARARLVQADSALAFALTRAREEASARVVVAPSLAPEEIARRDSLRAVIGELDALIARVDNAPLPSSYRALADAAALRGEARVRQLVDSLTEVERERDDFAASGAVDPVFVSLTARVTAIGRTIQGIGETRRAVLALELSRFERDPAPVVVVPRVTIDTLTPRLVRDSAATIFAEANRTLARMRAENAAIEAQLRAQRERANTAAPPIAILAAAIVLGLTLGFGLVFAGELRRPRVADRVEVEFTTGARVLAVLRPREIPPERRRRRADRDLPPFLDPTSDAYRLLASHLTVAGSAGAAATIAGDVPALTAVIAANVAAVAANDSRVTLLVDAHGDGQPVAGILKLRPGRGLTDVLADRVDWPAVVRTVPVGRDRTLDVILAGSDRRVIAGYDPERLRSRLQLVARRYDASIIATHIDQIMAVPPSNDLVICAQLGATPLRALRERVAELRQAGVRVIGIVLWDADVPVLPSATPVEFWTDTVEESDEALAGTR